MRSIDLNLVACTRCSGPMHIAVTPDQDESYGAARENVNVRYGLDEVVASACRPAVAA